MDDPVSVNYAGWPERIFVVGTEGKIAYAGSQGPWGFYPSRDHHPYGSKKSKNLSKAGACLETFLDDYLGDRKDK